MDIIDKNAYWVAHQPMRSISDADRAKLQRRAATLQQQTPSSVSTSTFQKKVPASSLDPELRDIFEKKLKSSAFFKPVTEATTMPATVSPEIPSLPEQQVTSSESSKEDDNDKDEMQSEEEMKKKSILLKRTFLFAERRKKEGREVFRRRTVR